MPELFFGGLGGPSGLGVDSFPAELFGSGGEVKNVCGNKADVVGVKLSLGAETAVLFFTQQVLTSSKCVPLTFEAKPRSLKSQSIFSGKRNS